MGNSQPVQRISIENEVEETVSASTILVQCSLTDEMIDFNCNSGDISITGDDNKIGENFNPRSDCQSCGDSFILDDTNAVKKISKPVNLGDNNDNSLTKKLIKTYLAYNIISKETQERLEKEFQIAKKNTEEEYDEELTVGEFQDEMMAGLTDDTNLREEMAHIFPIMQKPNIEEEIAIKLQTKLEKIQQKLEEIERVKGVNVLPERILELQNEITGNLQENLKTSNKNDHDEKVNDIVAVMMNGDNMMADLKGEIQSDMLDDFKKSFSDVNNCTEDELQRVSQTLQNLISSYKIPTKNKSPIYIRNYMSTRKI